MRSEIMALSWYRTLQIYTKAKKKNMFLLTVENIIGYVGREMFLFVFIFL